MNTELGQKEKLSKVIPFKHLLALFVPALLIFVVTIVLAHFQSVSEGYGFWQSKNLRVELETGDQFQVSYRDNDQVVTQKSLSSLANVDLIKTDSSTSLNIYFDDYSLLSLAPSSVLDLIDVNVDQAHFKIQEGKLFLDNIHSDLAVIIDTAEAKYTIRNAALVLIEADLSEAIGIAHAVKVDTAKTNPILALSPNEKITWRDGEAETQLINLYDKTIDSWIVKSLDRSIKLKSNYQSKSRLAYAAIDGGVKADIDDKVLEAKHLLSVFSISDQNYLLQKLPYLFSKAQNPEEITKFASFVTDAQRQNPDLVSQTLHDYLSLFYGVLPEQESYALKDLILNFLYSGLDRELFRLNETLDLLRQGELRLAKTNFDKYQKQMTLILSQNTNPDKDYLQGLLYHKQILDDMYLSYFHFYEIGFFNTYFSLKSRIRTITEDKDNSEVFTQDFADEYLKILTIMISLMKEKVISGEGPLQVADRLIIETEIALNDLPNGYLGEESDLFYEETLAEMKSILSFMNSSEYKFSNKSFTDAYLEYLAKQNDLTELNKYLDSLEKEEYIGTKRVNPATIIEGVYNKFSAEGLEIEGLKSLDDSDYRLFSFDTSIYKGIAYSGRFDNDSDIVYSLNIDGQKISSGVQLKDLADFIIGVRFQSSSSSSSNEEDIVNEPSVQSISSVEKAAIKVVKQDFTLNDFKLLEDNIEIVDLNNDEFYISLAVVESADIAIEVSFDYNVTTKKVRNLKYESADKLSGKITESFSKSDIVELVLRAYEEQMVKDDESHNSAPVPRVKVE